MISGELAFKDLEEAYGLINRYVLWRVLRNYGVNGKLLDVVRSFARESK